MSAASSAEHSAADSAWGETTPLPVPWTSGPWSLERRGDELADIRVDGRLVLRSIRAVARDRDWNTVPTEVVSVDSGAVDTDADMLRLGLRMTGYGADLEGRLELRIVDESLTVSFEAISHTEFLRNRIGLIVLHPPGVAGAPLVVTSPTGSRVETSFPDAISPHQPAMDIAALDWRTYSIAAELAFTGEIFEMEDQRNWTDASFKTYSTPLAIPYPVRVGAGERITQTLTLRARAVDTEAEGQDDRPIRLVRRPFAVPSIGVSASTSPDPLPPSGALPADSVLVELDARTANWRAALARAASISTSTEAHGLPLDVRIVADTALDLPPLVEALAGHRVTRLGTFSATTHVTEPELWDALTNAAALLDPPPELLGGARSHFTELNRNSERLPVDLPALAFSITPQMHARERAQLIESIAMQRAVAQNAVRIADGRPVHIGPITLRARFNAVATSDDSAPDDDTLAAGYGAELFDADDPRQGADALLAWTVASATALTIPGVASITWFETTGPRGIRSTPAETAFEWLHELSGAPAITAENAPDDVWIVGAGESVLVANLRPTPVTVTLELEGSTPVIATVAPFAAIRTLLPLVE